MTDPKQLALGLSLRTMFHMDCQHQDCTVTFFAQRSTRRFCSDRCRQKHLRDKRAGRNASELTVTRTVHGT
jgi:hypothetical protein